MGLDPPRKKKGQIPFMETIDPDSETRYKHQQKKKKSKSIGDYSDEKRKHYYIYLPS